MLNQNGKVRVFSTFSGIGGFEKGITAAIGEKAEFIAYSEIDKYAIKVYEHQFKGVPNYGDITKINAKELPDFDLLVGGFPCQAFSVAGKRAGFNDTRGTLFFDIARILKEKRPRHLVLENVKGLLSHEQGKTFTDNHWGSHRLGV
jgi:DNA (cytosine-5)-methyltransferase 1